MTKMTFASVSVGWGSVRDDTMVCEETKAAV